LPDLATTVLSALLAVVTYLLAGRLLLAHTGRNHETTPLQALLVGGSLWWVWSVAGHGLLGLALDNLWWLFMLSVVALSFVLGKTHQNEGHSHTFWSRVFLVLLLVSPWMVSLVQHVPAQLTELKFDALWPGFIAAAQGLPAVTEVAHFHLMQASLGSSFAWLGLPQAFIQGQYTDAQLPIFNVILLGLLATEILRWRGITLDQDKVFAAVPAAFILVAAIVAILGLGWVWSSLPYVLLAAVSVAVARIVWDNDDALPGIQALHLGLLLLLLAQVTVYGLPLAVLAAISFSVKTLAREQPLPGFTAVGLVWLLPLVGVGLWLGAMLKAGYPAPGSLLVGLIEPQHLITWPLPEALLTLLVVGAVYGIFSGAEKLVRGLGFHALGLGASFVLLGIGIIGAHAIRPQPNNTIATTHVQAVAATLQNSYLKWGEGVAVLDRSPYYSGILRAKLGRHNPVLSVGLPNSLATLQNRLQALGVKYLWVHAPDDQVRGVMDSHLQSTASYLYQLGQEGLILKAVFPHPGYTSANL